MALPNRNELKPQVLALRKSPRGRCAFCGRETVVEKHHVNYRPSITVDLCHDCHFKVHFFPQRLSEFEIRVLLNTRYSGSVLAIVYKTEESLNKACSDMKRSLSLQALHDEKNKDLHKGLAPSRKRELQGSH